jgi:hypothetical protein
MCKEGVEQNVRIFLTDAFKAENHGLTLVIREACSRGRGWKGVTLEEARKKMVGNGAWSCEARPNIWRQLRVAASTFFVSPGTTLSRGQHVSSCAPHTALGLVDQNTIGCEKCIGTSSGAEPL